MSKSSDWITSVLRCFLNKIKKIFFYKNSHIGVANKRNKSTLNIIINEQRMINLAGKPTNYYYKNISVNAIFLDVFLQ